MENTNFLQSGTLKKRMVYEDSDDDKLSLSDSSPKISKKSQPKKYEDSEDEYGEESEEEKYEEESEEEETKQRGGRIKKYVDSDEEEETPKKKISKKSPKKPEEKVEEEIIDPEFLTHIPSYTAYTTVQRRGKQKDFGYVSDPSIEKLRMAMQQINTITLTFDDADIESIVGSGSSTRNIDILNPICYVLGYSIVDKNGDINKSQIQNIFTKILKNLDTKIEQPDIIRYARLWAQVKRSYKHIST